MTSRIVINPAAEPAQAGRRAAASARIGMFAASRLFAAMTTVAGLATGRRLIRVPLQMAAEFYAIYRMVRASLLLTCPHSRRPHLRHHRNSSSQSAS